MRIGLTGGIGSGKSTAAAIFADAGVTVVDADAVSRAVTEPGSPALDELAEAFGADIVGPDGRLDRELLARRAFADEAATARLNAITHPRIAAETERLLGAAAGLVVWDVPLLLEQGREDEVDLVVVVDAAEELRLRRLRGRGLSEEDARRRMARQVDDAMRREKADVLLDNNGTEEALGRQVDALIEIVRGSTPYRDYTTGDSLPDIAGELGTHRLVAVTAPDDLPDSGWILDPADHRAYRPGVLPVRWSGLPSRGEIVSPETAVYGFPLLALVPGRG